jgi:hypothetical protein
MRGKEAKGREDETLFQPIGLGYNFFGLDENLGKSYS